MNGVTTGSLSFLRGTTYTFNVSNSTNTGHVINFSTTLNGTIVEVQNIQQSY